MPSNIDPRQIESLMSLTGKVALVTGATKGVGASTAKLFSRLGAKVVASGRNVAAGEKVVEEIVSGGGEAIFVPHDVTQLSSWESLAEVVVSHFGGLHILVNNAGVHQTRTLLYTTEQDFDWQVNTNLKGTFLGCKTCIPIIKESLGDGQFGSIINVSSIAGLVGVASQSLYNMTKGGLQLFSKSLALEMAGSNVPIRVNCVNPGMIETDMGDELVQQLVAEHIFDDTASAERFLLRQIPMRRFATRAEVAKAILFLASDASSYMTGTEMVLDGGLTAG